MKKRYILAAVSMILAVVAVLFVYDGVIEHERLLLALKWSGLESIADNATELDVKSTGGPFSRSFSVNFQTDSEDLEAWLASDVIQAGELDILEDGRERYTLEPQAGARVVELFVDRSSGQVELLASWS